MANANVAKIGVNAAVAKEVEASAAEGKAAEAELKAAVEATDERRVVGTKEVKLPSGAVLVVTNI